MNMNNSEPIPEREQPIYSHSIKIEDTAKGIRLSVHVYTNDKETAIKEVFEMYLNARQKATDNRHIKSSLNTKRSYIPQVESR